MKPIIFTLTFIFFGLYSNAQSQEALVKQACMDYIEGFYQGDSEILKRCLKENLYKFGFWKDEDTGDYGQPIYMSYEQALAYADRVKQKKEFPKPGSPKKVEVLDVMEKIAVAKVTAWWGSDFMLLSKNEEGWMIEQVIWEGPLTLDR